MTARPRLSSRTATLLAALAAVLAAAAAVTAATESASAGDRATVGLWSAVAAVAWCAAVAAALVQRRRARRLARELATARSKGEAALAAVLRAEAATGEVAAEAQAARVRADAFRLEAESARAETLAARSDAVEARAEAAAARAAADDERAELLRLGEHTIPEVVRRLRAGASVDTVLVDHRQTAHEDLLTLLAREVAHGERQRAAALAVCATAAGRVQALATSMHAELRAMQHRHDEAVLGDLLSLDHGTSQVGRMADSIAVLTGARSGRRWSRPIPVESVLRGALGRIGAYQRVRPHSASTAAVAGYAAEGVMHVLAELMDNAANFSAPPAEVHVYVEELHTGLAITVEDGGLGLSELWQRRAEQAVSGEPLDLTTLSTGTRLGFAVVGALARKHGLSISFRPSSRGGTGVVVLVPAQLISHQEPLAAETAAESVAEPVTETFAELVAARSVGSARAAAAVVPSVQPAIQPAIQPSARPAELPAALPPAALPPGTPAPADELPRRRRGQTLAASRAATTPAPGAPAERRPPNASRLGAFRQAVQGTRLPVPTPPADLPEDDPR
ncbi:ATP-binding protein [Kitasatospora viridis]|uniref:histidine kinase n=1 Tax=Kitasatospora viridis TaxID=281105 RepID=A0A561UE14_9ACTN|nr:ATP-binding protein [Kitasatospora viridis]TWF97609.1 histidine kinase/DNA gyrase B/HSP90-like ATPase [Kitasatospora viridis]